MLRTCNIYFLSKLNEIKVIGSELIQETDDMVRLIRDHLKKSYGNLKCRDIKYSMGNKVFLKVSSWKNISRFGRKGKLRLRFIRPCETIERIGAVAYRLVLPAELREIHNVFHVLMFKKYRSDPSHVISIKEIEIQPDLSYEECHAPIPNS
ncbi:DNA/RNA polymerases superfamily protein [Gossypium australe]|uniref:DNA/RNA polymerases superfamily protein n=1 Tax=Gossypium australe TaxID=47621 RepID=A0A5B6VYX4_9ROSI|nr:DNA/RNA polymerases superfamily protein [Gossypium australe]